MQESLEESTETVASVKTPRVGKSLLRMDNVATLQLPSLAPQAAAQAAPQAPPQAAPQAAPQAPPQAAPQVAHQITERENEAMRERFAKLLLGEDMSGGGKGVSSALALSNAITNTAAAVFGEQRKLEPMHPEQRARWKREIESLLSVTDYIVEFAPCQQMAKDGTMMEVMKTKQRSDLQINIPALKKLDVMLINTLDNFKDQKEFYYVSKGSDTSEKKDEDEKWWLPTVKVPPDGLSEDMRRWIQSQKESVNQVLKAAMAINAQVLSEMEVPENYIETLPKNGRSSLGEAMYKSITIEYFDPEQFLAAMDLGSEHKIVDLKDRIEASIVIWKRKMICNKDTKASWGVKLEKREVFEDRAETILLILKHRFPGISQSALDISKIQFNRDVGHAILESYSRILESLAHKVLSQIDDVIRADSLTQTPLDSYSNAAQIMGSLVKNSNDGDDQDTDSVGEGSRTLLDFMTWPPDDADEEGTPTANEDPDDSQDNSAKGGDDKSKTKQITKNVKNYMRF